MNNNQLNPVVDLIEGRFRVLGYLVMRNSHSRHPVVTSEIAEVMDMHPKSISRILRKLKELGYIGYKREFRKTYRTRDGKRLPTDYRNFVAWSTPEGRSAYRSDPRSVTFRWKQTNIIRCRNTDNQISTNSIGDHNEDSGAHFTDSARGPWREKRGALEDGEPSVIHCSALERYKLVDTSNHRFAEALALFHLLKLSTVMVHAQCVWEIARGKTPKKLNPRKGNFRLNDFTKLSQDFIQNLDRRSELYFCPYTAAPAKSKRPESHSVRAWHCFWLTRDLPVKAKDVPLAEKERHRAISDTISDLRGSGLYPAAVIDGLVDCAFIFLVQKPILVEDRLALALQRLSEWKDGRQQEAVPEAKLRIPGTRMPIHNPRGGKELSIVRLHVSEAISTSPLYRIERSTGYLWDHRINGPRPLAEIKRDEDISIDDF